MVQKELKDVYLQLARRIPCCLLDVLHYGRHWGYPGGVGCSSLFLVTARPATKAPVTSLYLRGRRCTAAPSVQEPSNTVQHRTIRNLVSTRYADYVPARHLRIVMCRWRCTAGVTPCLHEETKPRKAVYKQNWKIYQNTVYRANLKVSQKKGLTFYQTRSDANHVSQHSASSVYLEGSGN